MPGGGLLATLGPLRAEPGRTGIFTDFDGTLAPIVAEPAAARPLPGAGAVLAELARTYARVGVVSGRPVAFLQSFFAPELVLVGIYGLERVIGGRRQDHPLGDGWREVIDEVVADAAASGPDGMRVEPKGLSVTVHYRGRPDLAAEVRAWAERQAGRSGLELRSAKMSFELHPPIPVDKGSTILELAEGLSAVVFVGDDVGDLPAFDALDVLAASGVVAVRVAVRSGESDPQVLDRADLVVDGPLGALSVLEALVVA